MTACWTHLVGFGEAMVRLTSPVGTPLPVARQLDVSVGGAELNALVAARHLGMPATWVSALPEGPVAEVIRRQVAAEGVDLVSLVSPGTRVGLYFLDAHAAPLPSAVTYDRAGSAFSLLDAETADWAGLLRADSCLLIGGITPALGLGPRAAMHEAIDAATAVGAAIALDVNFRPSLWSAEECFRLLAEIAPRVSVLSASRDDLHRLGVEGDDPYPAAVDVFDLDAVIGTAKDHRGQTAEVAIIAADRSGQVRHEAAVAVVDAVGTGDALFGTFLAALPHHGLDRASGLALGSAAVAYGTIGDLVREGPWDIGGPTGGVRR